MVERLDQELDSIITRTTTTRENGVVELNVGYSPSVKHSERFVDLTGDKNPIHLGHPEFKETISPGFLQTVVVLGLTDEISGYTEVNQEKFPFLQVNAVMNGAVVTGLDYNLQIIFDRATLKSSARLTDAKGNVVYELSREISNTPIIQPKLDSSKLVHRGRFSLERWGEDISGVVGITLPNQYIPAIAGASSAVFDAIADGKLPKPHETVGMYAQQNISCDSTTPIDLREGINLELYLSDIDKFGQLSGKGETFGMTVVAKNDEGRFLYRVDAPLSFQQDRIFDIVLKRALRSR